MGNNDKELLNEYREYVKLLKEKIDIMEQISQAKDKLIEELKARCKEYRMRCGYDD